MTPHRDVGRPLVFIHIPKTAGTSLRLALSETIGARRTHVCFDPTHLGSFDPSIIRHPPMRARLMTRPEDYPADADLVVGHVAPSMTRVRFPDAPHLTVLREGRSRIISMWLYSRRFSDRQLRRWGPGAAMFQSARLPLRDYLSAPVSASYTDNLIVRQLVWPHPLAPADGFIDPAHDDELLETATASLAAMEFTAVVEDPDLAAALTNWLGRPLTLDRGDHGGVIAPALRPDVAAEVDAAADLLAYRSRLDQRLWQRVAQSAFPDEAPGQLADRLFARTVARHVEALATAPAKPIKIRVADRTWQLMHARRGPRIGPSRARQ